MLQLTTEIASLHRPDVGIWLYSLIYIAVGRITLNQYRINGINITVGAMTLLDQHSLSILGMHTLYQRWVNIKLITAGINTLFLHNCADEQNYNFTDNGPT